MNKESSERRGNIGKANGKGAPHRERADFTSLPNGQCTPGHLAQSPYESHWAAHQEWAAGERPDHQVVPVISPEARRILRRFSLTPAARRAMQEADRANKND